jgi:hypothetical protein
VWVCRWQLSRLDAGCGRTLHCGSVRAVLLGPLGRRTMAHSVLVEWAQEEVLAAVEAALTGRPSSTWVFERADLIGDELRVVFHVMSGEPGRFATMYTLEPFEGPNTGEECRSIQDWANEIAWDLDENIDNGGLIWAARYVGENGLVFLDWRA